MFIYEGEHVWQHGIHRLMHFFLESDIVIQHVLVHLTFYTHIQYISVCWQAQNMTHISRRVPNHKYMISLRECTEHLVSHGALLHLSILSWHVIMLIPKAQCFHNYCAHTGVIHALESRKCSLTIVSYILMQLRTYFPAKHPAYGAWSHGGAHMKGAYVVLKIFRFD